ncbi:hypothetical protein Anas_10736 [Armadillidium nasatum]|uniref:C2H2-type domain-containing protein n=1 Tax=Armadillidium nasatum TaxID=96803 RepID=A0A5N5SN30_9CRUS|nr:hypothetical protein Anas_10736 [Armadillidium nasatum]
MKRKMVKKMKVEEDNLEKNQENPKVEDRGKEKPAKKKNSKNICKICGKTFRSKSAMYGHSAMHVRKKEKMKEEMNNRDEDMQVTETEVKCPIPKEEKPDPGILHEGETIEDGTIKLENLNVIQESDEKGVKIAHVQEDMKAPPISDFDIPLKKEGYDSGSLVKKEENKSIEESNLSPFSENKKDEIYCAVEVEKENVTDTGQTLLNNDALGSTNENGDNAEESSLLKCTDMKSGDIQSRSSSPSDDIGDNGSSGGTSTSAEPDLKNLAAEPDVDNFELVAASFLELRDLILKFGSLPPKYKREKKEALEKKSEDEEEEENDDDEEEEKDENVDCDETEDLKEKVNQVEEEPKRPKCEQKLHQALCKLLHQLGASELKLNSLHRQLRKKIWGEYLDWHNRESAYVDPAEEVWKSDPEPEPTPSATQTPKPSSSSSSSEESYNEDGTRKRKLRKRRVKRLPPPDPPSPPSAPNSRAASPVNPTAEDTIAVSSRGRVRKVKRIVNYDRLDFDKLAQEAEEEAEKQKERKKKKKEEDTSREIALREAAQSLHIPSSGVRRYIISKEGEVVGYIGNDGQVHSGYVKPKEQEIRGNQSQEKETTPKKINAAKPPQETSNKTPKVVVSAVNQAGTLVYVRLVGIQALEMMKLIESSKNDPPRQIKLQRFSQTFTFYTNSYILTENIPGYPDSDTSDPQVLAKLSSPTINKSLSNSPKVSPKKTVALAPTVSSPEVPASKPPNPVALAYQGVTASTTFERETIKPPPSSSCATLSASTRLVFASPSAVPSVPPITPTTGIRLPVSSASTPTPLLVQTENGQQLQVGLSSEKLSQIVQKTGQRIVAIPNDKGGYTISLIPSANTQTNPNLNINKNVTTCSQGIQGSPQKSVVAQLLPTAVSGSSGTTHQSVSIIKNRLPTAFKYSCIISTTNDFELYS